MAEARMQFNENPLGPNPLVVRAIIDGAQNVHQYGTEAELESQIAAKLGLDDGMVLLGNGSIELIEAVAKRFLGPGKTALTPQCSFMAYSLVTKLARADLRTSPMGPDFSVTDGLRQDLGRRPAVLWLANPNNPTGRFMEAGELSGLLAAAGEQTITVLDEAYIDFVDHDRDASLKLLSGNPNLLISRTFSKAHGIAGLRIGFMLGNAWLIDQVHQTRLPMSVSALAIAAAQAAISDDAYIDKTRRFVADQRQIIVQGLTGLGLRALPSQTNFISFEIDNALRAQKALATAGVCVRELTEFGMPGFLRVSIGSPENNQRFLELLTNNIKE